MNKIENDQDIVIIGISGYATSGKDTFAAIAKNYTDKHPAKEGFIYNFASELKIIADSIIRPHLGIDCLHPSADEKRRIRKILVGIGQGFRDIDEFFWVRKVKEKIEDAIFKKTISPRHFKKSFFFIPDCRNYNECSWIHSHKNGFVISITRNGVIAPNDHEAETIPNIASEFADFNIKWPNISSNDESYLTNPILCDIVEKTMDKIYDASV